MNPSPCLHIGILFSVLLLTSACTKTIYVDELDSKTRYINTMDIPFLKPSVRIYTEGAYYAAKDVMYNDRVIKWRSDDQYDTPFSAPISEITKIEEHNRVMGTVVGFVAGWAAGYMMHNAGYFDQTNKPFGNLSNEKLSFSTGMIFATGGFVTGVPIKWELKRKSREELDVGPFELEPIVEGRGESEQ